MSLSFFIPCVPPSATAQQKGVMVIAGKPRFFKKARIRQAENTWHSLLQPHAPPAPLQGPLSFVLELTYPWRKSEKKSVRNAYFRVPMDTRPDAGNIAKMCEDVMTTLRFWNDDSQIAALIVRKFWGDEPGIRVRVLPEIGSVRTLHEDTTTPETI